MTKSTLSRFALPLALCLALTACAGKPAASADRSAKGDASMSAFMADPVQLTVFAAASMTETLNTIAELYKAEAPEVSLVYNFDSSGTLKTQIQAGALCDLFVSAGQKQMDQLDKTADPSINTEGLDFVREGTRVDLLANEIVLIEPKDADKHVTDFADLGKPEFTVALGNADVPVGQYAQQIFTSLGLWDKMNAERRITFGSSVKEVVAQVEMGAVDCGVVYRTDAAASDKVEVVAEAPKGAHQRAIYPAAVLHTSENPEAAKAFLHFLQSDACKAIFQNAGFAVK